MGSRSRSAKDNPALLIAGLAISQYPANYAQIHVNMGRHIGQSEPCAKRKWANERLADMAANHGLGLGAWIAVPDMLIQLNESQRVSLFPVLR